MWLDDRREGARYHAEIDDILHKMSLRRPPPPRRSASAAGPSAAAEPQPGLPDSVCRLSSRAARPPQPAAG